jgi:myo-inositol-1(or 4)-monophosphatase
MEIESIARVIESVRIAGAMALDAQRGTVERDYKQDGSVLTEIDRQVEDYLFGEMSRLYPQANVITEEATRSFDPAKPYTFAVDPIDGTDVFSQGMAGWCVSVGLLDRHLTPIAGVVFAPRLDLFILADVGKEPTVGGRKIPALAAIESISARTNLMVSSDVHKLAGFAKFPGKIRSIGSAALHLCFPVVYPGVAGSFQRGRSHIWDIAAAHAVNLAHGFTVEYLSGETIGYAGMVDGSRATGPILSGPRPVVDALRAILTKT